MAKEIVTTFDVATRTEFGKGASRRLRREGKIPAVLYGTGGHTLHISVASHDLNLAIRKDPAQTFTLVLDGTSHAVKVQAIARDPLSRELDHLDFVPAS